MKNNVFNFIILVGYRPLFRYTCHQYWYKYGLFCGRQGLLYETQKLRWQRCHVWGFDCESRRRHWGFSESDTSLHNRIRWWRCIHSRADFMVWYESRFVTGDLQRVQKVWPTCETVLHTRITIYIHTFEMLLQRCYCNICFHHNTSVSSKTE